LRRRETGPRVPNGVNDPFGPTDHIVITSVSAGIGADRDQIAARPHVEGAQHRDSQYAVRARGHLIERLAGDASEARRLQRLQQAPSRQVVRLGDAEALAVLAEFRQPRLQKRQAARARDLLHGHVAEAHGGHALAGGDAAQCGDDIE
jgi:hypothetical protein